MSYTLRESIIIVSEAAPNSHSFDVKFTVYCTVYLYGARRIIKSLCNNCDAVQCSSPNTRQRYTYALNKKLHTGDFLPVAPWDYASVASIHRLRRNGGPMNANSSTRNVVEWFSRFLGLWLRRTTKASSGGAEMMCTSWCLRVVNLDVNFSWGLVKVSDVKLLRTVKDRIENCQGQDHVQLYITSQYVTQEVKCE